MNLLSKLNPCKKTRARLDAEYIAMRQHEPLPPTLCEKIKAFLSAEWKWVIGFLLTAIGLVLAAIKLFR